LYKVSFSQQKLAEIDIIGFSGLNSAAIKPKIVGPMSVIETFADQVEINTLVELSNPINYTLSIPVMEMALVYEGAIIGRVMLFNVEMEKNATIQTNGIWKKSLAAERFASQYISGEDPIMTVLADEGTFPTAPKLSQALSGFNISLPFPKITRARHQFLLGGSFHLLSQTASFIVENPLDSEVQVTSLDASIAYDGKTFATIDTFSWKIPPGVHMSVKLPVDIDYSSIDRSVLWSAIGGTLQVDGHAKFNMSIGKMHDAQLFYTGKGLDADIRW